MDSATLTFESFLPEHIEGAVRLSKAAGWPHREQDWALTLKVSTGVVALEDGKVVATALATKVGEVATANMIIVDSTMRGRGLGRKIMLAAMEQVKASQWRLIATQAGYPLYEKLGFETVGTIVQLQGAVKPQLKLEIPSSGMSWAEKADHAAIAALDFKATGMDRSALLEELLAEGQVVLVSGEAGLGGYAVIRLFGRGKVIGPVIAKSEYDARKLYSALLTEAEGDFVRTDIHSSSNLASWLEQQGLETVDEPVAMVRGASKHKQSEYTPFALASQALG